jgi:hypothetical protein
MIRPWTVADIPNILPLLATEQDRPEERNPLAAEVVEQLFPRLFFETPHADPELTGLVSVGAHGQLTGMIGRVARQMEFRGEPVRAAVSCELFVDPAHRTEMLGVKLLKRVMAGPQDLLISDIANDTSRKIWTGLGGQVASWYGLSWTKVLKPAQFGLAMIRRQSLGTLAGLLRFPAAVVDRLVSPRVNFLTSLRPPPKAESVPLTREHFLELFPRFSETDELRPVYDRETIDWIWPRLDFFYTAGPSEQRLVTSPSGEPLGWYIYQTTTDRVVRVSQLVALPKTIELVFNHLLHHAASHGAVAVCGRVIPRFLQTFSDHGCLIRPRSAHTLIHARRPELLESFATGRAFLSLFESEGPLQAWINPGLALQRLRECHSTPVVLEPKPPISASTIPDLRSA